MSKEVQSRDKRTIFFFFFFFFFFFTLCGHYGHLGQARWVFNTCIGSPSYKCFIYDLVLIGQTVSEQERFKYDNIHVHVYCPGVWGRLAHGFQLFKDSLIFSPTAHFMQDFPLRVILTVSPFICIGDLCYPYHKIGQGHHSVAIYFVYASCQVLLKSVNRIFFGAFANGLTGLSFSYKCLNGEDIV